MLGVMKRQQFLRACGLSDICFLCMVFLLLPSRLYWWRIFQTISANEIDFLDDLISSCYIKLSIVLTPFVPFLLYRPMLRFILLLFLPPTPFVVVVGGGGCNDKQRDMGAGSWIHLFLSFTALYFILQEIVPQPSFASSYQSSGKGRSLLRRKHSRV